VLAFPVRTQAHSPIAGLGDFANGFLHPLTTLPHVLLIVGLGLMAGRQTLASLKTPFWTFASTSALALAFTATGWVKSVYPPILVGLVMCLGILLALEVTPSALATSALFAAAAMGLGLDSGVEAVTTFQMSKTLLGTWISLNVLIFDLAIYVSFGAGRKWLQIALRVAGSWLVAISVMVLAFSLRK